MTKIKSPFAACEATLKHERRVTKFRGESFPYTYWYYQCDETGIIFTTSELDDRGVGEVYAQYREKYGIPSPEELKATRKKYGLSATKMSEVLGMGINQYRLYEDGEMPSLAVGKVLKSIEDPYIFKRFLDNSVNQFSKKDFEQMEAKVSAVFA
ncbi:MAG: hypothetical protein IJV32_02085 [Bacteroidales bacterium]|nr:hypothetical protein [Bacteroidales bacterium]